jgi:hypothetical protein
MGKHRPQKSTKPDSEPMLAIKPPIHRVAANSIVKNAPVKKELFQLALPVAAARIQPAHINGFIKKYAVKYATGPESC